MFSSSTASLFSENVNFSLFSKLTEKEINHLKNTFISCNEMAQRNSENVQQSDAFAK